VVPGNVLERLNGAHVFRELDRSRLPNWHNLDADVMARLAVQDPGNRFAAAYLWGTTGIGINVTKSSRILPDATAGVSSTIPRPFQSLLIAGCPWSMRRAR
jgi:putrescine transport system substrate-binding protein